MMNPKGKQSATLKDIANKTGYSVNTVSRALRDKDDIAPATRERIKAVALEMGHIGNTLASSLRLGYTNTIAVILSDVSNPHFAVMMKEIEGRAGENGYSSFLINTNEDEDQEMQAIQSALNKSVDGIIICPTQKSETNILYLKKSGVPFVLIGRHSDTVDTDYVVCNDELGGYQATRELLDLGHRNILMLHGPIYISSARERLAGYRRAYAEAGIPVEESLIHEVSVTAKGDEQILCCELGQGRPFTAVFAFSDFLAWQVWHCLRRQGLEVPRDCSLIGFDHIQSRLPLPFPLTSISSYKGQMSTAAADLLIKRMKDCPDGPWEHVVIDTKLARGETVAPLGGELEM